MLMVTVYGHWKRFPLKWITMNTTLIEHMLFWLATHLGIVTKEFVTSHVTAVTLQVALWASWSRCVLPQREKVKSASEPGWCFSPVFLSSTKWLNLLLDGMLIRRRVTHSIKFAGTHLYFPKGLSSWLFFIFQLKKYLNVTGLPFGQVMDKMY